MGTAAARGVNDVCVCEPCSRRLSGTRPRRRKWVSTLAQDGVSVDLLGLTEDRGLHVVTRREAFQI